MFGGIRALAYLMVFGGVFFMITSMFFASVCCAGIGVCLFIAGLPLLKIKVKDPTRRY